MDAREREHSQSGRPSSKRPWDEDISTFSRKGNGWNGAPLPPIDAVPHHAPQIQQGIDSGPTSNNRYGPEADTTAKRPRYDRNEYQTPSGETELVDKLPHSRASQPIFNSNSSNRAPLSSPSFPPKLSGESWERRSVDPGRAAGSQETAHLCRRCRRAINQHPDADLLESYEDCKRDPELGHVTQAVSAGLTQLAETLSSGIPSEQKGALRLAPEQRDASFADCPPLAQVGLKSTLNWILDRLQHVNTLAERLVQYVPPGGVQKTDKEFPRNGSISKESQSSAMKRPFSADADEALRLRADAPHSSPDSSFNLGRRPLNKEELPVMRSPYEYHLSNSSDGPGRRVNMMNPPPVLNRQLPSPPGRSLSSPTAMNFPSPSAGSYGNTSQPVNLPPPPNLHQNSLNSYLPPISSSHSSDSALQAHTAALQHEVSVQKIAYSSLQGEHDKLLAAYSRSQTRASTLEKKQSVADAEVISLAEEKSMLQTRVMELEKEIEDLSRSRDECRQVAVQEATQYVEIVKKASQLEEMAAEERKSWNMLKADMEQRIEALKANSNRMLVTISSKPATPDPSISTNNDEPLSSISSSKELKIEPAGEVTSESVMITESMVHSKKEHPHSTENLHEEIRQLRTRCTETENALRIIRDESLSIEGIVEALGLTGRSILERANKTLETGSDAEDD